MKFGFYPKLAADGIRKNKKMYLPYILTSIGMVTMFYIVIFLQYDGMLQNVYGSDIVITALNFGGWVIALFSCAFMFYTNSFLMRRRKKEFGLYNILGMDKRNIARIVFWENAAVCAISLASGFLLGITFSKLAEMLLIKILRSDVTFTMTVPPQALLMTLAVFGAIFLLLLLNSLRQIYFSKAISLVQSENAGERAPRGNWLLGLLGALVLAAAYFIAIEVADPVSAFAMFFIAVIMVIVATYLLMIAGSVLMCRILQKNKRYYYKAKHFTSVSSMAYRMKRNGAGLASICILSTMVLVMISSTSSLYFGAENTLSLRYPREINVKYSCPAGSGLPSPEEQDDARACIVAAVDNSGADIVNIVDYSYISFAAGDKNGELDMTMSSDMISSVWEVYVISAEDYESVTGKRALLDKCEVLVSTDRADYDNDVVHLGDKSYRIKEHVDTFVTNGDALASMTATMYVIVSDLNEAAEGLIPITGEGGSPLANTGWIYSFDTGVDSDSQREVNKNIREAMNYGEKSEYRTLTNFRTESRAAERNGFYSMYGSLFFLGIMLSIVFVFAAVLIIYYKQISEGYEDQSRFEVMQKVGMTKRDIRKSINSQLLTVFFLPLAGAALHLAFAFPMIRKMLLLFGLDNIGLFAATTVICFAVFCIVYIAVYKVTSNAYFKIVSGGREK